MSGVPTSAPTSVSVVGSAQAAVASSSTAALGESAPAAIALLTSHARLPLSPAPQEFVECLAHIREDCADTACSKTHNNALRYLFRRKVLSKLYSCGYSLEDCPRPDGACPFLHVAQQPTAQPIQDGTAPQKPLSPILLPTASSIPLQVVVFYDSENLAIRGTEGGGLTATAAEIFNALGFVISALHGTSIQMSVRVLHAGRIPASVFTSLQAFGAQLIDTGRKEGSVDIGLKDSISDVIVDTLLARLTLAQQQMAFLEQRQLQHHLMHHSSHRNHNHNGGGATSGSSGAESGSPSSSDSEESMLPLVPPLGIRSPAGSSLPVMPISIAPSPTVPLGSNGGSLSSAYSSPFVSPSSPSSFSRILAVLASGDRDFSADVRRLRRTGFQTLNLYNPQSHADYIRLADEFFPFPYLEPLAHLISSQRLGAAAALAGGGAGVLGGGDNDDVIMPVSRKIPGLFANNYNPAASFSARNFDTDGAGAPGPGNFGAGNANGRSRSRSRSRANRRQQPRNQLPPNANAAAPGDAAGPVNRGVAPVTAEEAGDEENNEQAAAVAGDEGDTSAPAAPTAARGRQQLQPAPVQDGSSPQHPRRYQGRGRGEGGGYGGRSASVPPGMMMTAMARPQQQQPETQQARQQMGALDAAVAEAAGATGVSDDSSSRRGRQAPPQAQGGENTGRGARSKSRKAGATSSTNGGGPGPAYYGPGPAYYGGGSTGSSAGEDAHPMIPVALAGKRMPPPAAAATPAEDGTPYDNGTEAAGGSDMGRGRQGRSSRSSSRMKNFLGKIMGYGAGNGQQQQAAPQQYGGHFGGYGASSDVAVTGSPDVPVGSPAGFYPSSGPAEGGGIGKGGSRRRRSTDRGAPEPSPSSMSPAAAIAASAAKYPHLVAGASPGAGGGGMPLPALQAALASSVGSSNSSKQLPAGAAGAWKLPPVQQ